MHSLEKDVHGDVKVVGYVKKHYILLYIIKLYNVGDIFSPTMCFILVRVEVDYRMGHQNIRGQQVKEKKNRK